MKQVSVLLVSGNKDDFQFIRELLSHSQQIAFRIDWKDTFTSGLQALDRKHYDIALVNDDLGLISGSQFIQQAEQSEVLIPVILFTCGGCWDDDQTAFQSSAIYCLTREKMTTKKLVNLILKDLDWELMASFLHVPRKRAAVQNMLFGQLQG